jgi:hypothetical protein
MENTQKRPKIIISQDDKSIVKRMKKRGVWPKMKELSKPGETIAIIDGDELFIWHGTRDDSGYSFFKSPLPDDLVLVAGMACNNSFAAAG